MLIAGGGIKSYYDIIFKDKYFILDYFDTNIIDKFVDSIMYLKNKRSRSFELLVSRLINDLLIQFLLLYSNAADDTFTKAIEYIEENYEKKISIDELADIAKISKYHFIRKFKKTYSETPYEFIIRYKINKSKIFLLNTDYSVDEVSMMVGFNDTTTFIRAFKKLIGTTPNKYREQA